MPVVESPEDAGPHRADAPVAAEVAHDHVVIPTIEGAETFTALEKAIRDARTSVIMAYWTFDPNMPLGDEVKGPELQTWGDLVCDAVRRGVQVRIILTDFDPILTSDLHAAAISAYRTFVALGASVCEGSERFQVIVSRHPADVGLLVRWIGMRITRAHLGRLVDDLNRSLHHHGQVEAVGRLGNLPGVWPWMTFHEPGLRMRAGAPPVHPAVHHEKLCVVDGEVAFLGGVDIDRKRYDTPRHEVTKPWHDVACRVEGPMVRRVESHLRRRWNTELVRFHRWRQHLRPPPDVPVLPCCRVLAPLDDLPVAATERAPRSCEAIHTRSRPNRVPWARGSTPVRDEIARALRETIGSAREFLYIENQYLRSRRVARWILQQARRHEDLEVIVLLPLLPEAMLTSEPDRATQHGHYLQMHVLSMLQRELGARIGIFTLLRNGPAPPDVGGVQCLYGSDLVYVHAKVLIADDREAVVGSANLNERSLQTDTETSMRWRSREAIGQFRQRLWNQHFNLVENGSWEERPYLARWTRLATQNAGHVPGRRQGFVVPMPQERIRYRACRHWLVPDRNV